MSELIALIALGAAPLSLM